MSAAAHPPTPFRSFSVRFLGSALVLATSLKSLHEDPPGSRKLPCRGAHLLPGIAWSNRSMTSPNIHHKNKQGGCGPGFAALGCHLRSLPPPLLTALGVTRGRSEILLPRCLFVAGLPLVTGGRGILRNPTPAVHRSGNFHERPSGLNPVFSKI